MIFLCTDPSFVQKLESSVPKCLLFEKVLILTDEDWTIMYYVLASCRARTLLNSEEYIILKVINEHSALMNTYFSYMSVFSKLFFNLAYSSLLISVVNRNISF